MKQINITTLLLCISMIATGCVKNYSVIEFKTKFKKAEKLFEEWAKKCV